MHNKETPRARRGVFRLVRMHLHLNARETRESSARRKASSSSAGRLHNFEYFSLSFLWGNVKLEHTHFTFTALTLV
jgi:hypothetical protein